MGVLSSSTSSPALCRPPLLLQPVVTVMGEPAVHQRPQGGHSSRRRAAGVMTGHAGPCLRPSGVYSRVPPWYSLGYLLGCRQGYPLGFPLGYPGGPRRTPQSTPSGVSRGIPPGTSWAPPEVPLGYAQDTPRGCIQFGQPIPLGYPGRVLAGLVILHLSSYLLFALLYCFASNAVFSIHSGRILTRYHRYRGVLLGYPGGNPV